MRDGSSQVDQAPGDGVEVKWMLVTPELAREWLALNTRNRKSSKPTVRRYIEAMETGGWFDTTDAIGFYASDGALQNGQQRLDAIAQCGRSQWMLVMWGLSDDSSNGQDVGRRRTAADLMWLAGLPNDRTIAAAYRYLLYMRAVWSGTMVNFGDARHQPKMTDIVELAKQEDIRYAHEVGRRLGPSDVRFPSSLATALMHEFSVATDFDSAQTFFERLMDGVKLDLNSPIYRWHRALIRAALQRDRIDPMELAAKTIKAYRMWMEGVTTEQLSWRAQGDRAEVFPTVTGPSLSRESRRRRGALQLASAST